MLGNTIFGSAQIILSGGKMAELLKSTQKITALRLEDKWLNSEL